MAESPFDRAVIDGVVRQFFEPSFQGTTMEGQAIMGRSPAAMAVDGLYQARKDEIVDALTEVLDADTIAAAVAKRILEDLAEKPLSFSSTRPAGAEFRKAVTDRTIEILAQRQADEFRAAATGDLGGGE